MVDVTSSAPAAEIAPPRKARLPHFGKARDFALAMIVPGLLLLLG